MDVNFAIMSYRVHLSRLASLWPFQAAIRLLASLQTATANEESNPSSPTRTYPLFPVPQPSQVLLSQANPSMFLILSLLFVVFIVTIGSGILLTQRVRSLKHYAVDDEEWGPGVFGFPKHALIRREPEEDDDSWGPGIFGFPDRIFNTQHWIEGGDKDGSVSSLSGPSASGSKDVIYTLEEITSTDINFLVCKDDFTVGLNLAEALRTPIISMHTLDAALHPLLPTHQTRLSDGLYQSTLQLPTTTRTRSTPYPGNDLYTSAPRLLLSSIRLA